VIVAYRDNDGNQPIEILDTVARNGALTAMTLKALNRGLVVHLLADTLR
jgi:predicted ATPase